MISRTIYFLCFLFQLSLLNAQDTTSVELLPVEIRAERAYTPEKIALNRSHFLSAPASFDDPSRLLMKYPGFSVSNDQNNAIIYDGLPSHYSTWSLYGAQIANPNHLSNAGTANDRPSRSSGGVNMFSGQVIGGLDYHTGTTGPAHGVGGVADMSIRTPYQNSITANLSLIGLEAGIDQIFNEAKSSLLANYRYSTVGLLGQMGVDFGGDMITYQDMLAEYKTKWKGQEINITTAYGISSNNFENQAQQDDVEATFKEIQNIELEARNITTAVSMASEDHRLTLAYSSRRENKNNQFIWNESEQATLSKLNENIISLYGYKTWNTHNLNYTLSLNVNQFDYDISDFNSRNVDPTFGFFEEGIFFENNYFELRPRGSIAWNLSEQHILLLGSSFFVETLNNEKHFLPFISYRGKFNKVNTLFSIQNDRQSPAPEIRGMFGREGSAFFSNNIILQNINAWTFKIDVNRSNHGVLLFSHLLFDTPYNPMTGLSALSELGQLPITPFGSIQDVAIFGVKVHTAYDFNGYRLDANYSFMESIIDEITKDGVPLDYSMMLNLKLDKSFKYSDTKSLRISTSFHFRNGFRRMSIDENESRRILQTVYDGYENADLNSYQRLDLRVSYIKKGRWKNVISLDIQNVLNRQNDAYYYFDPVLDENVLQKQLGLIPILSWRVVI